MRQLVHAPDLVKAAQNISVIHQAEPLVSARLMGKPGRGADALLAPVVRLVTTQCAPRFGGVSNEEYIVIAAKSTVAQPPLPLN